MRQDNEHHVSESVVYWEEPARFRFALGDPIPRCSLVPTIFGIGFFAVIALVSVAVHGGPLNDSWPITIAFPFGAALLPGLWFGFAYPLLLRGHSPHVQIASTGIERLTRIVGHMVTETYPWEQIEKCEVTVLKTQSGNFPALVLHLKQAQKVEIGLGKLALVEQIKGAVVGHGMPITHELPTNE